MLLGGHENSMLVIRTDDNGSLTATIHAPESLLVAQPDKTLSLMHLIKFEQDRPIGGYEITENGHYAIKGMLETIMMALMATFLAIFIAIPISFLAARNLMGGNPLTFVIYLITRTILNIIRSIEPIIIAIIFVIMVGLGPFAGVLALGVHSVAALGKLYSEALTPDPLRLSELQGPTGCRWCVMASSLKLSRRLLHLRFIDGISISGQPLSSAWWVAAV